MLWIRALTMVYHIYTCQSHLYMYLFQYWWGRTAQWGLCSLNTWEHLDVKECRMKLMGLRNNEKEEKVHIHICIRYACIPSHVRALIREWDHQLLWHMLTPKTWNSRDEFKSHKPALLWQLFANLQRRITVMSFSWSWLAIQELHLRYIIGVIHTMGQNRCFTMGVLY